MDCSARLPGASWPAALVTYLMSAISSLTLATDTTSTGLSSALAGESGATSAIVAAAQSNKNLPRDFTMSSPKCDRSPERKGFGGQGPCQSIGRANGARLALGIPIYYPSFASAVLARGTGKRERPRQVRAEKPGNPPAPSASKIGEFHSMRSRRSRFGLSLAIDNPPLGQVVGGQFDVHFV